MRQPIHYVALAVDYDGTIAHDGMVDADTIAALEKLRPSGRSLILVTGRELDDLLRVMPRVDVFDRVVAENGALIYCPATRETRVLAEPPPPRFVERLREAGVSPLSVGRVIVASWEPNETKVLAAIHELGLELQIIFNKGAVMVLPPGVNKESGLRAALAELDLAPLNCVAIGDAENDFAFFNLCGAPVAVANALPSLKEAAVLVTAGERGAGVAELIDALIKTDLSELDRGNTRQQVRLADPEEGADEIAYFPHREALLVAGASGGGKSTLTLGLLERLVERGFQYCVIDPEGDYETTETSISVGTAKEAPRTETVLDVLRKTTSSVAVNLLGVELAERPRFFAALLSEVLGLRARTGRPHLIVVDEAHHVLPAGDQDEAEFLPGLLTGFMFVTVSPAALHSAVLAGVDRLVALGADPASVMREFCAARGVASPDTGNPLQRGELLTVAAPDWQPRRMRIIPGQEVQQRHSRKYAEGKLGEDKSFFFRGPDDKLNLRARNLVAFIELADGVDDETWSFHRSRGDYSQWIETAIKDSELAAEVTEVEQSASAVPAAKAAIRDAIERKYTLPASG